MIRRMSFVVAIVTLISAQGVADECDILAYYQVPVAVKKGQRLRVTVTYGSQVEQCLSIFNVDTRRRIKIFNNRHTDPRYAAKEWTIDNTADEPIKLNITGTNKKRDHWDASCFRINHSGADYTEVGFEDGVDSNFTDIVARITIEDIR